MSRQIRSVNGMFENTTGYHAAAVITTVLILLSVVSITPLPSFSSKNDTLASVSGRLPGGRGDVGQNIFLPSERTRYGSKIIESFKDTENIDLDNTSAGVDTSKGAVFIGGIETFPGKLILTAMDNAHNGDMKGIAGADRLVNKNAAEQGFGASRWKAFLSSSKQNVRDIIPEPYASSMTIVDRNERKLFNDWNDIFDGSHSWQGGGYLKTFCNRDVNENTGASPDWSDADGWHGSDTSGRYVAGQTCNDWTSTSHHGLATELDARQVLRQERNHNGGQTLAVMAIELPGALGSSDRTLAHVHSEILHDKWSTIGAAKMTWYEHTPPGTEIVYNLTADNEHWVTMKNNTDHVFEQQGSQMRWNATLRTGNPDISPTIYKVVIEYDLVSRTGPELYLPRSEEWQGTSKPTLDWNFSDPDIGEGDGQSEYLIEIFGEGEPGQPVYNSSWVASPETSHEVTEELEDGVYFWRAKTKDSYGAPCNYSSLKKLKIDTTKPRGGIIIENDDLSSNEELVGLSVNATDSASGVDVMQIINDRGSAQEWEPFKEEKTIALSSTDGLKTVGIRFRDNAGIVSDIFNDTIYLDLKGPGDIGVSSPTHPDPEAYYASASPVFRWDPPYEVTEIKGYNYVVDASPNSEPYKDFSDPVPPEKTETTPGEFPGLKDGTWFFHITACDVYNQWSNTSHFRFNIDSTPPIVSEIVGDEGWSAVPAVETGVIFEDVEGYGLDLESINYAVRETGEEDHGMWLDTDIRTEILERGVSDNPVKVKASVERAFPEGGDNAVKWRISDLSGNGPVESEATRIRIDATPVAFSEAVPAPDEVHTDTLISCGITLTDEGSGVDGSTVEYAVSAQGDDERYFKRWMKVGNNRVDQILTVQLMIEFDYGKENYIRWRAADAVGNGPAMSDPFRVWVNSPPVPEISSPRKDSRYFTGDDIALSAEGTEDDEDDELTYWWEIKNRTSKRVVKTATGKETNTSLEKGGAYLVYLYADDNHGFNESAKVQIYLEEKSTRTGTSGGTDPYEKGGSSARQGNLFVKWWWLIAGVLAAILILIIVALILFRKKKREKQPEGPTPVGFGPPGRYAFDSSTLYPMQPPYDVTRSAAQRYPPSGSAPSGGGPGWTGENQGIRGIQEDRFSQTKLPSAAASLRGQPSVGPGQPPSLPPGPGTHQGQYQGGGSGVQAAASAGTGGQAPGMAPGSSGFGNALPQQQNPPAYTLPEMATPQGTQNLNRPALPPAPDLPQGVGETGGSPGSTNAGRSPGQELTAGPAPATLPDVGTVPGTAPGSRHLPQ